MQEFSEKFSGNFSIAAYNGTICHWFNGEWDKMEPNLKAAEAHIEQFFNTIDDKSEEVLETILENSENHFMSAVGELGDLIAEQETLSVGQFIETTKQKAITRHTVSLFVKIKKNVIAVVSLVVFTVNINLIVAQSNWFRKLIAACRQAKLSRREPKIYEDISETTEADTLVQYNADTEMITFSLDPQRPTAPSGNGTPLVKKPETPLVYPELPETSNAGTNTA